MDNEHPHASWNPAFRPDTHIPITPSTEEPINQAPAGATAREDVFEASEEAAEEGREEHEEQGIAAAQNTEQDVNEAEPEDQSQIPGVSAQAAELSTQPVSPHEQRPNAEHQPQDAEAGIFQADNTTTEQEAELEDRMPESAVMAESIPTNASEETALESLDEEQILRPEQDHVHYDYQGEVTQLEEAVDEAPSAPLLLDEEAPPTVADIKESPVMRGAAGDASQDFESDILPGQALPKAHGTAKSMDRSFTTNFTELPAQEPEQLEERMTEIPTSNEWPSAGDDRTFGELLGDDQPAEPETEQAQSVHDSWGTVADDDALGLGDDTIAKPDHPMQLDADGSGAGTDNDMLEGTAESSARPAQQLNSADDGWGAVADGDAFGEILGAAKLDDTVHQFEATPVNEAPEKSEEELAAMWQAALDDDELLEDTNDLDPSSFFGDDDDGFLEDDVIAPAAPQPPAKNSYVPAQPAQEKPQLHSFQSQFGQTSARSGGTPTTGLYDVYNHLSLPQEQEQPQRPALESSKSFADKSKGGYQSPYDLPMDVVKQPRQRPRQSLPSQAAPTAPPRSTSMSSQQGYVATPPPPSFGAIPTPPPPQTPGSAVSTKTTPQTDSGFFADLPMAPKLRARPSGAYTPQAASVTSPGPPPQMPPPPTQQPREQMPPPPNPYTPSVPAQTSREQMPSRTSSYAPSQPAQQPVYGGLTRPESLPLLPDQPATPATNLMHPPPAPPQNQRYSPSLPATIQAQNRFSPAPPPAGASSTSRYSPAPNAQPAKQNKYAAAPNAVTHAPPAPFQRPPFAPRTSSPLAYQHDKPHPALPHEVQRSYTSRPPSPSTANDARRSIHASPERTSNVSYTPTEPRTPISSAMGTPPRPTTQSPATAMKSARYTTAQTERSISAATVPSARPVTLSHRRKFSRDLAFVEPNDERSQDPLQRWKGHPIFKWGNSGAIVSSFPKQTPFYAAGHGIPSIKCTLGDITVQAATTFMPMNDRNAKFPGPLTARAKGRKKDVLVWLTGKIEDLERDAEQVRMDFQIDNDLKKRTEEKLVLWKVMRVFVENDGSLEGSPKIADAVRPILLPNLAEMAQVMDLQSPAGPTSVQADPIDKAVVVQLRQALLEGQREKAVWLAEENKLWGHAMLIASTMGPETWQQIVQSFVRSQVKTVGSDARSLAALYQVFAGNAEECVDELVPPSARAGFQMVSKSDGTVSGNPLEGLDQWRETLGLIAGNRTSNDVQSLLALGKLLGGYGRAEAAHTCYLFARQIAKHTGADDPEVNFVLLGADHTSKTESFANDIDAIILTEIYEWASSLSAPSSGVAYIPHLQAFKLIHAGELAGSGLKNKAQQYCDHITSAYTSTTRPSQYYHPTFTQSVAELSAFLSQTPHSGPQGLISKAAMNKVSSGAASWFTKFVSGEDDKDANAASTIGGGADAMNGPFGRVNGDSPAISREASSTDLYSPLTLGGPLHPTSTQSLPMASQQYQPSSAPSKYAPSSGGSRYAPAAPSSTADVHSRPGSTRSARSYTPVPAVAQALAAPRPANNRAVSDYSAPYNSNVRRGSGQYGGAAAGYESSPMYADDAAPYGYQSQLAEQPVAEAEAKDEEQQTPQQHQQQHGEEETDPFARPPPQDARMNGDDEIADAEGGGGYAPPSYGYQPSPSMSGFDSSASTGGYEPPASSSGYEPSASTGGYEPPSTSSAYQPPASSDDHEMASTSGGGYEPPGYEPPSSGGYEPPSYQPYNPDESTEEEEEVSKPRKSMLDDDEDDTEELARRAAAMQKAAADKAADEAFRAAAEADAARDNKGASGGSGEKKGWFGGWFKKDAGAIGSGGQPQSGPIRAKLGEENSFVYDETLKKWVDKKAKKDGSGVPEAAASTPPPPRGPPSRAASGMAPPPMGMGSSSSSAPPSRNVSGVPPAAAMAGSGPPSRVGTPADVSAGGGGSGMIMPPAVAALNGSGGSGPPSRPSSSMSHASSLDDLLGGPPGAGARKVGGTVKAKKKGGRYVDVMAK